MTTETILQITGLHCGSGAQRLSGVLLRGDGVFKADVDPDGEARIRFDEATMDEQRLAELLRTAGFDVAADEQA